MSIKISRLLIGCFLLSCISILYYFPPTVNSFYPPCIWKYFFNMDCPGCGSARCLSALVHGNVQQAADYNLLLLCMLPLLVVAFLSPLSKICQKVWTQINQPKWVLVLTLLFWVLRNSGLQGLQFLHSDI